MKWTCVKCLAINPFGSHRCHCCHEPLDQNKLDDMSFRVIVKGLLDKLDRIDFLETFLDRAMDTFGDFIQSKEEDMGHDTEWQKCSEVIKEYRAMKEKI